MSTGLDGIGTKLDSWTFEFTETVFGTRLQEFGLLWISRPSSRGSGSGGDG